MKFYPYCLISQAIDLPESVKGLDERPLLQRDIGGLTAILSECDAEKAVVSRENVLRHDAVIRTVLEQGTTLPFRFGHLVTLDQLTSYVESKSEALQERLRHLEGRVEMSAKIIWNREIKHSSGPHPAGVNRADSNPGKGAAFLRQKRDEMQQDEALSSEAAALAAWLKAEISGLICDERIVLRPTEKLVLSASFLVDRAKLEAYKMRTASIKNTRSDLHFLTSGPWPPYSFSNNELEFKTQLGVS